MDSEFKQFLDTLRRLGISYTINHRPTKEDWQHIISRAGYNVTAFACTVIEIGYQQFLFCNSQLQWDNKDRGYGPAGLFMLCRNKKTKRIINRQRYNPFDGSLQSGTGLKAARAQYPVQFGLAPRQ
jgi:hypothetical protein